MTTPSPLLIGNLWPQDTPGGLDRYLAELLAALRRHGSPAIAVVIGPAANAPVGVVAVGRDRMAAWLRTLLLSRAAHRASARADVIDSHFALSTFLPLLSGRLRGLPLVVHFQGPWAEESRLANRDRPLAQALKRAIEWTVYRRAREVLTLSTSFKRVVVERYGIEPWRVRVQAPGVNLEQFTPSDRQAARARFALPPEATVAVCVRRHDQRMGIDVLIDAWPATPDDHLLLIGGSGKMTSQLELQVARSHAASRIRFTGRLAEDELVDLYRAADMSIVPSIALEGFGLIVLESLACGTPVISTDVGGLPEALVRLDPSLVVTGGDPEALASRITAAASGEAPLPSRQRCRAHAEAFSWDRVARQALDTYGRAIRAPTRRPLRVVFLDHCAQLSGGELALLRTLPHLKGIDVHVILGEDGPMVARLLRRGISTEVRAIPNIAGSLRRHRVTAGPAAALAAPVALRHAVGLAWRLRRLRPDIVHTNSLKSALYGGLAARLAGIPAVWHIRDRIADDYLPRPAVHLVRALARVLPSAVIANSQSTLTTIRVQARPTAVVPSPVDESLIDVVVGDPEPPNTRIGMIGRLAPWKGQHLFLEAFARAFPKGSETAVIAGSALFGENDYEASLHQLADRLGMAERVEFAGFVDDVGAELRRLTALVHASLVPEPFGQVVIEGMAAGVPVVAARAGGPAETINDGVDGILFAPGDVEDLAAAMKRVARDRELRRRLRHAGHKKAQRYAGGEVASGISAVYRSVLDGRCGPEVILP